MNYNADVEGYNPYSAAAAPATARGAFIRRTYLHLAGAILAFVAIEALLFSSGAADTIIQKVFMGGGGKIAWIALMVAFVAAGYVAQLMARSKSAAVQYAGLGLYVLMEVLIFLPILYACQTFPQYAGKSLPLQAGIITLVVFGGLTAFVMYTGKDFSFLGGTLCVLAWTSLAVVVASALIGFSLGLVFFGCMVALAAGYIVYDTSNVLHHYDTNEHVGAALQLFASVALMFFYVLRILMSLTSSNSSD